MILEPSMRAAMTQELAALAHVLAKGDESYLERHYRNGAYLLPYSPERPMNAATDWYDRHNAMERRLAQLIEELFRGEQ